jgi:hypothetical protein
MPKPLAATWKVYWVIPASYSDLGLRESISGWTLGMSLVPHPPELLLPPFFSLSELGFPLLELSFRDDRI